MRCIKRNYRNNQCMDFDDLIMNTIRLFKENEDALQFYQRKFHYIHVDEYQDTNHAQYTLVNLLADRFKIFVSWEMRIKVSMAGGVPICKIFWTSKRLSGCSSDFVGTKLPLNSDDFECCESSHQNNRNRPDKICGLKIEPVKKSLTIAGIVNEMKLVLLSVRCKTNCR